MAKHILVIGGGPAGLRAAEVASAAGARVTLCDQMRSFGRKFLVAGRGGLNLTHTEERLAFAARYRGPEMPTDFWARALERFDNAATRAWAARMGIGTFAASSGRVYPKSMKGAPMLRAWLQRLTEQGVEPKLRHKLIALKPSEATFETPNGPSTIKADGIILALGGGSWARTGSDGQWVETLKQAGIATSPLQSANCGWETDWPEDIVAEIEGLPLKNLVATANGVDVRGEVMLTRYGVEGGTIYALGAELRAMEHPLVTLDLKPTFEREQLVRKMESVKRDLLQNAQQRLKLPAAAIPILGSRGHALDSVEAVVDLVKCCPIPLTRSRPIDEAISSAGGVCWSGLTDELMIKELPGIYVAGEMIDWEAPTGGYLLQGCFITGTIAAEAAVKA